LGDAEGSLRLTEEDASKGSDRDVVSWGGKVMLLDDGGVEGDVECGLAGKAEPKGDGCGGANGPETDRVRLCPCAKAGLRGEEVASESYALGGRPLGGPLNVVRNALAEWGAGRTGPETEVLLAWDAGGRWPAGAGARMTGLLPLFSYGAGTTSSSSSRSLLDLRLCMSPAAMTRLEDVAYH
jgi:hypothetical protein